MSWKTEVEALVGSVTDNDAISKWLQDGAWDVINKVKQVNPAIIHQFGKISEGVGDSETIGNDDVIAVYETTNKRTYREIPAMFKYRAIDSASIYEASSSDPVYYRENGTIYMLPTGGNNDLVMVSIDTNNLAHGGEPSETDYFPDEMKHLLVLYVSMQQLQWEIWNTKVPSDSSIDMNTISKPVTPSILSTTSSEPTWDSQSEIGLVIDTSTLAEVPSYIAPILEGRVTFSDYTSGLSETDPGVLSITIIPPVVPVLSVDNIIDTSAWTLPEFVAPVMSFADFADTDDWISVEEDPEMLAARVQEIGAKVQEFSGQLQKAEMLFNKDSEIFKAQVQKSIQDATLISSKDGQIIQNFSAEVQKYQSEVQTTISEYQQNVAVYTTELGTALQSWQKEETDKVTRFQASVTDALNQFNDDNTEYQATLQIAVKNAELSSTSDGILLQKFAAEIQNYQGEVQAKVQEYTLKSQGRAVEYKWLQDQYLRLKQQYEQGFVPFSSPSQEKD